MYMANGLNRCPCITTTQCLMEHRCTCSSSMVKYREWKWHIQRVLITKTCEAGRICMFSYMHYHGKTVLYLYTACARRTRVHIASTHNIVVISILHSWPTMHLPVGLLNKWSTIPSQPLFVDLYTTTQTTNRPSTALCIHLRLVEVFIIHKLNTKWGWNFCDMNRLLLIGKLQQAVEAHKCNPAWVKKKPGRQWWIWVGIPEKAFFHL